MDKGAEAAQEPSFSCEGRALSFTGEDGVRRLISLSKTGNNTLQLTWETWWDGDDKEPLRSMARLGMSAFNATMALLAEFQANPGSFPEPKLITQPKT